MLESWQVMINSLLYKVQFEKDLDDEDVIDWLAADLVEGPLPGSDADQQISELTDALRSGASLTEGAIPQPHSEQAVRDFLWKVVARMNDLRQ